MKERQKFVSKLCIGRNKTECVWQAWESHEAVIDSRQHTSTIACTVAPRVWHFSDFHYYIAVDNMFVHLWVIHIHSDNAKLHMCTYSVVHVSCKIHVLHGSTIPCILHASFSLLHHAWYRYDSLHKFMCKFMHGIMEQANVTLKRYYFGSAWVYYSMYGTGMVYIYSCIEQKCIDCKQLPWLHNVFAAAKYCCFWLNSVRFPWWSLLQVAL